LEFNMDTHSVRFNARRVVMACTVTGGLVGMGATTADAATAPAITSEVAPAHHVGGGHHGGGFGRGGGFHDHDRQWYSGCDGDYYCF
jgi:hypothetical protein